MSKPILIVGAGPVGMTMASELARFGVPVRIIDKSAQRTDKSKALVMWSRTLELLDRGGGSAPFIDAGFKTLAVNTRSPLNGPSLGGSGPKPGERLVPAVGETPVGSGDTPPLRPSRQENGGHG